MWLPYPVPIFLAVTAGLICVLSAGRRLVSGTFTSRRSFKCPFRETDVRVDFKEAVWDGSLVEVATCSAFMPPENVQCDRGCLRLKRELLAA